MIVTISGKAGSGKSTIAKILAEKLQLKHYSVGDVMRAMAKEKGITLLELNQKAETDPAIDKELDDRLIKLGKEEDNFIIDGRLTAFFIPQATHRIFLGGEEQTRAERILRAKRADEQNVDLQETIERMRAREDSEQKRYQQYYQVDYTDPKHYTIIVDTTDIDRHQVSTQVLGEIGKSAK